MSDPVVVVVVTDANILINFLRLGRLALLTEIRGWTFVIPEEVVDEIRVPMHREELLGLIEAGRMGRAIVNSMEGLELYAEFVSIMGKGEAACLALASTSDMLLASDEKKRFRRCAIERIGEQRIIGTQDIIVRAIHQRLVSVSEADELKAVLAANRYVMSFGSFGELI